MTGYGIFSVATLVGPQANSCGPLRTRASDHDAGWQIVPVRSSGMMHASQVSAIRVRAPPPPAPLPHVVPPPLVQPRPPQRGATAFAAPPQPVRRRRHGGRRTAGRGLRAGPPAPVAHRRRHRDSDLSGLTNHGTRLGRGSSRLVRKQPWPGEPPDGPRRGLKVAAAPAPGRRPQSQGHPGRRRGEGPARRQAGRPAGTRKVGGRRRQAARKVQAVSRRWQWRGAVRPCRRTGPATERGRAASRRHPPLRAAPPCPLCAAVSHL